MAAINQYSFIWLSAGGLAVLIVVLLARRAPARAWLAVAAAIAGLAAAFLLLQPTPASSEAARRLEASLGAGTPLLLELQSPY